MKLSGTVILIICSAAVGCLLSGEIKKKIIICESLISFCDALSYDMSFRASNVCALVSSLLERKEYRALNFIKAENVKKQSQVKSLLESSENEEISRFLYTLGKSDFENQIKLINSFKEYITNCKNKYNELYNKNSKVYIAFGIFFGCVTALVII